MKFIYCSLMPSIYIYCNKTEHYVSLLTGYVLTMSKLNSRESFIKYENDHNCKIIPLGENILLALSKLQVIDPDLYRKIQDAAHDELISTG